MAKKKLTTDISQFLAFPFIDKAWVTKLAIASGLIFCQFHTSLSACPSSWIFS